MRSGGVIRSTSEISHDLDGPAERRGPSAAVGSTRPGGDTPVPVPRVLHEETDRSPSVDPLSLIDREGVARLFGISLSTLDRLRRNDSAFPQPIQLGNGMQLLRWRRNDLEQYLANRPPVDPASARDSRVTRQPGNLEISPGLRPRRRGRRA